MTNHESYPMHRRTLLTGVAVLGASAATACSSRPLQSGQQTPTAAVEQNTTKRRGVGLRAFNPERASPGFTLFAPLIWGDGRVYLIDLRGNFVHTWNMPPARPVRVSHRPGNTLLQRAHSRGELSQPLSVQGWRGHGSGLEQQGALGSTPSRPPSPRHPVAQWKRAAELHGPGARRHRPPGQRRGGGGPLPVGSVCGPADD
jgi:hypothetical protein